MIEIVRFPEVDGATLGYMLLDGFPRLATLELPWRGNERNQSCIPPGHYRLRPVLRDNGLLLYEVQDVPDRDGILCAHVGNTVRDTQGCIIVGIDFQTWDALPAVRFSRNGYEQFKQYIIRRGADKWNELNIIQATQAHTYSH